VVTLVYDTGVLLAAERGDRTMWAVHRRGLERAGQVVVPAVVLGQAWRGGPQPQLARPLKGCVIEPFDENDGRAVGRLLRDTGTSDVVDAHVVLTALRYRATKLTVPSGLTRIVGTLSLSCEGCVEGVACGEGP